MTVMRYDPWNVLDQMRKEMDKVFESRLGGEEGSVATSDWIPAMDIKEEKDRFVILADIPGVDPKAIDIHMENGILAIRGERPVESKEALESFKRIECPRGTFYRRFSLPDTADAEKISAKSSNGVLEVVIPKQERVQPRKITVEG